MLYNAGELVDGLYRDPDICRMRARGLCLGLVGEAAGAWRRCRVQGELLKFRVEGSTKGLHSCSSQQSTTAHTGPDTDWMEGEDEVQLPAELQDRTSAPSTDPRLRLTVNQAADAAGFEPPSDAPNDTGSYALALQRVEAERKARGARACARDQERSKRYYQANEESWQQRYQANKDCYPERNQANQERYQERYQAKGWKAEGAIVARGSGGAAARAARLKKRRRC
jgi:hypothetical protein